MLRIIPIIFFSEILIFFLFFYWLGFWKTIGIYFLPSLFIGVFFKFVIGLVARQPQNLLASPSIFGYFLLLLPSMFARALALILIFPPFQFLFKKWIEIWLHSNMAKGTIRVFSTFGKPPNYAPSERNVTPEFINELGTNDEVIDIPSRRL